MNQKITDTIKQDLQHQLSTFSELPFRLTLGSIADHYSVSLTPVRQVIEHLIEDGILLRKENGRLQRVTVPEGGIENNQELELSQPIKFESELDERVANDIIKLILENHQEYLREEATAQKYDTGRTIMRQVFSRLAGAGLIEHLPRCGWKVRQFREKDMFDYLEIREVMEVKALRLAKPHLKEDDLKKLLQGNIAHENRSMSEIDNDLHQYWITRCDNVYIQDFFDRHGSFYSAIFDFASLGEHIKTEMAQEHIDILEALIEEDYERAEKALIKHIRDQKQNVLTFIEMRAQSLG